MSVDSLLPAIPFPLDEALAGVRPPESGLGGRLVVRMPLGGWGNALMLIVFLIVFPAAFTPGVDFDFGRAEPPPPIAPGVVGLTVRDADGARRPLFGTFGVRLPDLSSEVVGMFPVLLRVFDIGNAGKAVFGGP